jgi:putative endonuclease
VDRDASPPSAPSDDRANLGRIGEAAAVAVYQAKGFEVVARNWRCSIGELDLVLARGRLLVICEVKTRRGSAFGAPFEAVHQSKRRKLRALAQVFLANRSPGEAIRFDVASVTVPAGGPPQVYVFEEAF